MTTAEIPEFLQGVLWSYDLKTLDIQKNYKRIATNILIYGDIPAVRWLFNIYTDEQIINTITHPYKGEWDVRSLNFWAQYFNVIPNKTALKQLDPI